MTVVASVPHTGSHWLLRLLGLDDSSLHHTYPGESLEVIQQHAAAGARIVVPLRHPMFVAQSWVKRGKPILPHPKHNCMLEMWQNLIVIVDRLKPLYLPLDTPDRDARLQALGAALGVDLATDWSQVGHQAGDARLTDTEVQAVQELMRETFFGRFY